MRRGARSAGHGSGDPCLPAQLPCTAWCGLGDRADPHTITHDTAVATRCADRAHAASLPWGACQRQSVPIQWVSVHRPWPSRLDQSAALLTVHARCFLTKEAAGAPTLGLPKVDLACMAFGVLPTAPSARPSARNLRRIAALACIALYVCDCRGVVRVTERVRDFGNSHADKRGQPHNVARAIEQRACNDAWLVLACAQQRRVCGSACEVLGQVAKLPRTNWQLSGRLRRLHRECPWCDRGCVPTAAVHCIRAVTAVRGRCRTVARRSGGWLRRARQQSALCFVNQPQPPPRRADLVFACARSRRSASAAACARDCRSAAATPRMLPGSQWVAALRAGRISRLVGRHTCEDALTRAA